MRKDQIYPSKYLKAPDLKGRDVTVTIEDTDMVTLQGKPTLIVRFEGKEKALVVKPSIFDQIEKVTGEFDTDNWPGHKIVLFATEQDFAGQTYDVIRVRTKVRPPADDAPAPRPSRPVAPPDDEDDHVAEPDEDPDSVPF